jgi:hypothetical protein
MHAWKNFKKNIFSFFPFHVQERDTHLKLN